CSDDDGARRESPPGEDNDCVPCDEAGAPLDDAVVSRGFSFHCTRNTLTAYSDRTPFGSRLWTYGRPSLDVVLQCPCCCSHIARHADGSHKRRLWPLAWILRRSWARSRGPRLLPGARLASHSKGS